MIKGYMKSGSKEKSLELFGLMPQRNCFSWNSVVSGFAKARDLQIARGLFDEMPMKNWIAWNSMIHGYARDGCPREAVRLFRELNSDPYAESRGDIFMLATVFGACTDLAALDCGKQIHARIIIDEVEFDSILASSLINLYGKVSSLGISENCKQMHARASLNLFSEMRCAGVVPTDIIFTGVLSACDHCGLIEDGRKWAGCLEEAMSLIEEISFEADASMWSSVLRGCVTHGDKSLAKRLAKQITDLDPENSGCLHAAIKHTCDFGAWERSAQIRKMMRDMRIQKNPGCSWAEC
ncbi:pentatricopeptide repeat (PPR) superfamily protein [Actinidia rufa]|uniref:Pentatricopeptide repeat (PPR) superfamily protein n=1 Tax=Actinidia rufa TaxID=165716 RepID=A0A7J0EGZ3_9ERIC|nr:pentatricopeptide repeat (PPR) superfamily protein [Actinidia rufa]